jgi:hypothetical protein
MKGQRAVLIFTDKKEGGVRGEIMFEPSIKKRSTQSPACNIAMRLFTISRKISKELAAPFVEKGQIITE